MAIQRPRKVCGHDTSDVNLCHCLVADMYLLCGGRVWAAQLWGLKGPYPVCSRNSCVGLGPSIPCLSFPTQRGAPENLRTHLKAGKTGVYCLQRCTPGSLDISLYPRGTSLKMENLDFPAYRNVLRERHSRESRSGESQAGASMT